ncbi:MAG: site-specific integrase [Myxococcota bacterium]
MASLSVDDLGGGRFKVRWRELVPGGDGQPQRGADGRLARRNRSLTVEGKAARDELVARVRRALLEEGEYQPPTASETPAVANLEHAALAWLRWKATRCSPRSVVRYTQHTHRFFDTVRRLEGIAKGSVVLATVLSRDLITRSITAWQDEKLSESYVYAVARSALEMWRWAADDPDAWPSMPTPPREPKALLPRPPIYTAPPAPTLAECDACLRHLPIDALQSRRMGTIMRFTGLRAEQVLEIRREDVDLANEVLVVRAGKSRAEKAQRRSVPMARALVAELRPWVGALPPSAFLFPAWGVVGSERRAGIRPDTFARAWEEATKWGEAREIAWKPANRKIARPEHSFRAAFQAALRTAGVSDEIIDGLVGHNGGTTRARHYAGDETLLPRMRTAVRDLAPVDWSGPSEARVVKMRAGRKG